MSPLAKRLVEGIAAIRSQLNAPELSSRLRSFTLEIKRMQLVESLRELERELDRLPPSLKREVRTLERG